MKKITTLLLTLVLLVSLSLSGAAASSDWPDVVRMGGASVGGMLYVIVGGFAGLVDNYLDVPTTVEETGGPVDNIRLIEMKANEMGAASAGPLYEAWNGEGWANGTEYRDIRAVCPTHPSYTYITFLQKNSIEKFEDLPEKEIGFGPRTGTPATQWPKIFDLLDVHPKPVFASFGDIQNQLKDGLIDGIIYIASFPYSPQVEMEAQMEAGMLVPPEDSLDAIVEEYPYFSKGIFPKGSYPSVKEDMPTVLMWTYMIGHKDLSEDFVYQATKKAFEEKEYLKSALNTWPEHMKPEVMLTSPIPLHPGAIKYYREVGLDIPDKLIPPEMK